MNEENNQEPDWEAEIANARAEEVPTLAESIAEVVVEDNQGFDEVIVPEELLNVTAQIEPPKKLVDIPNLSDLIAFTTISSDELQKLINENFNMSEEELAEKLNDKSEYITKLARVFYDYTNQQKLEQRMLSKLKDKLKYSDDIVPDKITSGQLFDKSKSLVGEEAKINMIAATQGLKKIYLPHSGFHIIIRKFETTELREILRYIDEEEKEIGKILGAHFYTVDDIFFKQKVCEILPMLVIDSNLKNWNKKDNLIKAISINDFDCIIHGICSLMYRNGIKHEMICPDIECKYVESVKLDLSKTKLIEYDRLSEKAISILLDASEFNIVRYKQYNEELKLFKTVQVKDKVVLSLKVPSIFTYLKFGLEFVAKMIKFLYSDNKPVAEEILEYRVINFYKMFLPWIEKVTFYKEDDTVNFETRDPEAISHLLESDVWESNENINEFTNFFSDSVLVHYGFLGQTCPSCGKVPNPTTNGFIPLDIRSFFFNLAIYQIRKKLNL